MKCSAKQSCPARSQATGQSYLHVVEQQLSAPLFPTLDGVTDALSLESFDAAGCFRASATCDVQAIPARHPGRASVLIVRDAVGPVMARQGSGKIVNLASIAGRGLSESSSSAYAAAKGGIIAFTKKLSLELGPHGVNVNAIAPSLTLTERIRPHWEQRDPESQAAEIARTPLRRVAEAKDQAGVICFLASHEADFVTGLTIDVTGGV